MAPPAQPLSPQTRLRLDRLFAPADRAAAVKILVEQCGNNLPFLEKYDMHQLERYRFAALKLSKGDVEALRRAVALAQRDWRDLLVAAEFANNPEEHKKWLAGE